MKCKNGFKEKNGKCVRGEGIRDYCDTNILTAFVNRNEIGDRFGWKTANRFSGIPRKRNIESSRIAKKIGKCVVDRNTLLTDIGNHNPSMAGILTSVNLSDISIKNINGEKEGIKAYNQTCARVDRNSGFYEKFCKDGKIKSNKELGQNNLNDVKHFGSAIKNKSEVFLTGNKKDFKPLEHDTNIKIE